MRDDRSGAAAPRRKPPVPAGWVREAPVPKPGDVAKYHFGRARVGSATDPEAIGSYGRGCLAGGVELPADGAHWQAMRPSRNRAWGHPELIAFLEQLAENAPALGWNGLLVGDLAQPRGGPMLTGHASHQIGLDGDIWLTAMPDRSLSTRERETTSAVSMLDASGKRVDPAIWTDAHARLIRRAASDERLARIFVHPAIKRALCDFAGGNGDWLSRVRPWYGHHYHFHVRLKCPSGSRGCKDQAAPPPGPGCGAALDWWFTDEPYKPSGGGGTRREITIAGLPARCSRVLVQQAPE